MNHKLEDIVLYIKSASSLFNNINYDVKSGRMYAEVDSANIISAITMLQDDNKITARNFVDLFATDYPAREKRFEVTYQLMSLENNLRFFIKTSVNNEESLPSICNIFQAAMWYEREAWDMYGVIFEGNPDLRRILTDYGFQGHPLRKDFPLTGYVEVRYDIEKKKVVYEPVKLVQEYRSFDFVSPWEGADYVLPGDEKASVK